MDRAELLHCRSLLVPVGWFDTALYKWPENLLRLNPDSWKSVGHLLLIPSAGRNSPEARDLLVSKCYWVEFIPQWS